MLAVATLRQRRSAFTASSTEGTAGDTKSQLPSVTATSGTTPSPSIARRAASFWAADMPRWSHSSWLTEPTDHATHQSASLSNSASRSRSVSSFESRTPFTRVSRGRIAAPTDNGPAHAPRPTSSIPTTTSWPRAHNSFSIARVGARFFDCFGRTATRPTAASAIAEVDADPDPLRLGRRRPQRLSRRGVARPVGVDRRRGQRGRGAVLLPQHRRALAVPPNGESDSGAGPGRHTVHLEVRAEPPAWDTERQQPALVGDTLLDLGDESTDRATALQIGERRRATRRRRRTAPVADSTPAQSRDVAGRPVVSGRQRQTFAGSHRQLDLGIVRAGDRGDRFDDLGHPHIGTVAQSAEFGHIEQESDRVGVGVDRSGEQQ